MTMEGESIEVRGRTTDEAIRQALSQLGVSRDEVDVEILSEGRAGVFGVGSQEARVRVTLLSEDYDEAEEDEEPLDADAVARDEVETEIARETLERMLDSLDFPNVTTVKDVVRDRGRTTILLDVTGDDVGLIIGRHGETLTSLQFLLNACLAGQLPKGTRVAVDVEHYVERREQSLRAMAMRAADRVAR